MYKRFFVLNLFLFFCFFSLFVNIQTVHAENYFDKILSGIRSNFYGIFGPARKNISDGNNDNTNNQDQAQDQSGTGAMSAELKKVFSKKPSQDQIQNQNNDNPFLDPGTEIDKYNDAAAGPNTTEETSNKKTKDSDTAGNNDTNKKPDTNQTLIEKILTKLGLLQSQKNNQNTTQDLSQQGSTQQASQNLGTPQMIMPTGNNTLSRDLPMQYYNPNSQASPFLQTTLPGSPAATNFYGSGNVGNPNQALQKYLPNTYNIIGGGRLGNCTIPKGPVAYNISSTEGSEVSCPAKSVAVGYKGTFSKNFFGIGYINPMTQKEDPRPGAAASNCKDRETADYYKEGCFKSYDLGSDGSSYVQEQILHFQVEGKRLGQSCVVIDIDNCDSIGSEAYKQLLDQVLQVNNKSEIKVAVINKNPYIKNCNFMSHPAVIGSMSEVEFEDAKIKEKYKDPITLARAVVSMRKNPEQIAIFGSGQNEDEKLLRPIANDKSLKNISVSFSGKGKSGASGEYAHVYECIYNP